MSARESKAKLLQDNRQLRERVETLEEVLSALYGGEMDAVDLKEVAAEAKARSRLALIVESSDDAIFSHARDGVVESWNPAAERLFGYAANEVIGRDFRSLIVPPEETNELARKLDDIWQGKRIDHEEVVRLHKGGLRVMVSVVAAPIRDAEGRIVGASVNMRDITERKRSEEELVASRDLLQAVVENIPVRVFWKDNELRYLGCNTLFAGDAGMTRPEELIGKDDFQMGWREQAERYRADDKRVIETGKPILGYEEPQTAPSGRRWVRTSKVPLLAADGTVFGMLGIYEDITERREMEIDLRESEQAYRTLAQNLPGLVYRAFIREGGRMQMFNAMTVKMTGYRENELSGGELCSIEPIILEEDRSAVMDAVHRALKEEGPFTVEYRLRHKSGAIRWMTEHGMPVRGDDGAPLYIDGVIFDVTENKRTQESLRQSEEKFRSLVESTSDWIWETDSHGVYTYASPRVEELLGYHPGEVLGKTPFDLMSPEEAERVRTLFGEAVAKHAPLSGIENDCLCKDGKVKTLETSGVPFFDGKGELAGYRGIDRDISDRKRAEEELYRVNRSLLVMSEVNLALVRATDEKSFLKAVTGIITGMNCYGLAMVGYAGGDARKSVLPMAWSGMESTPGWESLLSWSDGESGRLPVATAIRTGEVQLCTDIAHSSCFKAWRDAVMAEGYAANIAFPLSNETGTYGGLSIYATEEDAFDENEIQLLQGLAEALAYGINTLRVREEHEHHAEILQSALERSIQTIADTVAARDPYTAGHQKRVGELAVAIAREMGLPQDRIQGIHLAAIIHDLGKIHIPAEILTKPGKLTDVEYLLMQTHPQAGYDILKDVDFPWPIADIILQHHENMDGSGYPQGLKGAAILLEARIISVADVVEAMSSHRPYRPARGVEEALQEIERNRGIRYDPEVVDTCLGLFREGGYQFPSRPRKM